MGPVLCILNSERLPIAFLFNNMMHLKIKHMAANITQHTGRLTRKQAKHLLRRATYNVTRDRIDALVGKTPAEALTDVLLQQKTYTHVRPLFPRTDKVDGDVVSESVEDWIYNGPGEGGGDTDSGTRARRTSG